MTMTIPPMLTVPEASTLLRTPVSTIHYQIKQGTFPYPCIDRPRRVQTRAVLAHTGLTADEALTILADQEVAA